MATNAHMASERLRGVLEAVAAMSADPSLEGLLDRILRQAGELVDAESGFLDVLDRRSDRRAGTFAAYGIPGIDDRTHPGRQALVELLERPDPRGRDSIGAEGTSAFIGVPIKMHDFVFGNLYLIGKRSGNGFTRQDEEAAMAVAMAAGIVIENVRLNENAERQRLWLEAAAEITTSLLSPISRIGALQLVADRARTVAAADFVGLLMPRDSESQVVEAVSGIPPEGVLGEVIESRRSLVAEAARRRQTLVVPNTDLDPRYERRKTPKWPDLGSLMVLPLRGSEETGALVVGWLKGHQTDRWELDPVVPQGFADQAALVLQVARAQEDQARLAVFEDRDRIGRDLHDLVIQRLFGIGLMLDNTSKLVEAPLAVERLSSAIDDIDQTIRDIRRTIFALSPSADAGDLRTELGQVLHDAAKVLGFTPELHLTGAVDSVVTEDVREQLIPVLRETLSNAVRHAGASSVSVHLDVAHDICLTVEDDGRGLGPETGPQTSGNGLRNIRERADLLGGSCKVSSGPGRGTTVTWNVPRRNS
ncbi:GAF domain-containing sensor histidine kinase [Aeromicrobium wangtongii]|uniref:GAF domain-containing sensor histidine kinase n=1 Tax=Aeromicrobium wangtongii TaxID=2969247 RepID=UPI0020170C96|nr:GAF domain-containing sensor histidine kinase [Aeromicrobium wangtongii]MCL3817154.1 GAF domain-containing sensor histidine kinase [Aeromicrobium wangtongii]